jgi:hypothetical protein
MGAYTGICHLRHFSLLITCRAKETGLDIAVGSDQNRVPPVRPVRSKI